MNYVVAVAAPIGGGKTSLVKAIANELNDATTIHYDHYEKTTEEPVHNLMEWMKDGANFDDFIIPLFICSYIYTTMCKIYFNNRLKIFAISL